MQTTFHIEGRANNVRYIRRNLPSPLFDLPRSFDEQTPFLSSVAAQSMDAAKVFADHGAYVEARDVDGNSAWHLYVSGDLFNTPDDVWGMKLLKDLKIDVNMRNRDRSSPLHVAAFFGKPAMVYGLIDAGAIVDLRDRNNWTPLHTAIKNSGTQQGCHDAAMELLIRGANPNKVTDRGKYI